MKPSRFLLIGAGILALAAAPAQAGELLGTLLDAPARDSRPRIHSHGLAPAKGLQLASGLQASGPLNGSGPAPAAVRLSEEDWRKVFPRKEPRQ